MKSLDISFKFPSIDFILQFKIEPFKHPLKLDPDYAGALLAFHFFLLRTSTALALTSFSSHTWFSAEKTWKYLENAIHEINNRNSSGLSFEELHRYDYFSFKRRMFLKLISVNFPIHTIISLPIPILAETPTIWWSINTAKCCTTASSPPPHSISKQWPHEFLNTKVNLC